ncbi:response regulator [Asticcacaulis sp.]|uniref:response regulator n=1 Tax=Asticcacaulis sp. TaxID=1872648 RepID=UPI0026033349|nr:response regulator [Asticcacaulis sp.]
MTHSTALIIEDSAVQAQMIGRLISAQPGWSHIHFPTFREGYDALSSFSVQALFMDIFVGTTNGLAHIEAFRKRSGTAPIILMTAGSSQESIEETLRKARQARADFILRKPFGEGDVRRIFQTAFKDLSTRTRKKHALVIDDSRTLRSFIRGALEFGGYRVSDAESMEAAFRDVDIAHVDLVVCDVFMPGMGGIKGMSYIKQTWPAVPVIAMSAGLDGQLSETDALNATGRIGADAGIAKPFEGRQLLDLADRLLKTAVLV